MKKMKKWVFRVFVLLSIVCTAAIFFSPYGKQKRFNKKCVAATIRIKAPIDSVFRYMSHSEFASKWSVYVDHISPLNEQEVKDGAVGCKRRCYTQKNEKGNTWDEEVLAVERNKMRRLRIYGLKNFTMGAKYLLTEQVYRKVGKKQTELSLLLFFDAEKKRFFDELKLYFAAYKVADIFGQNLKNIKNEIERNQR